jgi:hypothetical protein
VPDPLRLPQDVGPVHRGDTRGVPDLTKLRGEVDDYLTMRRSIDDHEARALGCWGLVARWPMSRETVASLLRSSRHDDVEDAAGILGRVGIPDDMLPIVVSLIEALPDSTARDCLVQSLPVGHPRRAPDAVPAASAFRSLDHVPLRGAWEPYTSRIQFIEAPFERVAKEFSRWMREIQPDCKIEPYSGRLEPLLGLLDPYWWPVKRLLVETSSHWTAVFSNAHDTYEAHVLSERMRVRGVETVFSVDLVHRGEVRNYGGTSFELIERGRSVRTVHVSRQDSGWAWDLLGSELPFEESERYKARVKRDRFDIEMLNRYCEALGIKRSDAAFYGEHGLLHSEAGSRKTHPQYGSAAAWRATHLSASEK